MTTISRTEWLQVEPDVGRDIFLIRLSEYGLLIEVIDCEGEPYCTLPGDLTIHQIERVLSTIRKMSEAEHARGYSEGKASARWEVRQALGIDREWIAKMAGTAE